MTKKTLPNISVFISLVLSTILIGACTFIQDLIASPTPTTSIADSLNVSYPVDNIFRDFYDFLGGEEMLGPAISIPQESGEVIRQYVEAGLMVYDPNANQKGSTYLDSLGLSFGVEEPTVPNPNRTDEVYINGHIIYKQFLALYRKLGGARFVGLPITEVHYNSVKGRTEQYFENLGFYISDNDQSKTAHLLAYGTFACDQECRYKRDPVSIPASKPFLPQAFNNEVARLGYDFVGRPLTESHKQGEGEEIIFDNLVMVYQPDQKVNVMKGQGGFQMWFPQVLFTFPGGYARTKQEESFNLMVPLILSSESKSVLFRPIVGMVGIEPEPPVPSNGDPIMVFYPTDGNLGHNVPKYFNDYIQLHGGLGVSGPPVTEVFRVSEGIYRQCFTNLCLDFDLNVQKAERLYPVPLGMAYKEKYYSEPGDQFEKQNLKDIKITVWEDQLYVTSAESQVINVLIQEKGVPLKNWEPELILTMPDNRVLNYYFPPTDEDGKASIKIPPVKTSSGTLIPYRVCMRGVKGESVCVENNYLIWNIPR